jgi:hypothetical protein
LRALEFASLAMPGGAANPGGPGSADNFVGAQSSLAREGTVFGRGLQGGEEMAEERFTEVKMKRNLAGGDSGLVYGEDRFGAVKIVKGVPL